MNSEKFLFKNATANELVCLRKEIYQALESVSSFGIKIDLDKAREKEDITTLLFGHGLSIEIMAGEKNILISTNEEGKKIFDKIQDSLDDKTLAFVALNYELSLNIFLAGALFAQRMLDKNRYEDVIEESEFSKEVIESAKKRMKLIEEIHEYEREQRELVLNLIFKDDPNLEFVKKHFGQAEVLIEKGITWARSDGKQFISDISQSPTQNQEMREAFFKAIMVDEFLQKNDIYDKDKEIAFKVFYTGIFMEWLTQSIKKK